MKIYQNKTKDLNAFDFGDLILFCVKLFEEHKDIRKYIKIILNIFLLMNFKIQILFRING